MAVSDSHLTCVDVNSSVNSGILEIVLLFLTSVKIVKTLNEERPKHNINFAYWKTGQSHVERKSRVTQDPGSFGDQPLK